MNISPMNIPSNGPPLDVGFNPETGRPRVVDRLYQAAESNHGLTMEALQVREILSLMEEAQQALREASGVIGITQMRMDVLKKIVAAVVTAESAIVISDEMLEAAAGVEFDVQYSEEDKVLRVVLIENDEAPVSGVQEDSGSDSPAESAETGSEPPMPGGEGTEGT